MNKRQKEIQQLFLDNEKEVLNKLKSNYQDALDEINSKIELLMARQDADMQYVIYQIEYQKALKDQVSAILEQLHNNEFETVSEYLAQSYENGFIGAMYDLQGQGIPLVIPIDQQQVVAAIQHETKLSKSLYAKLGIDTKDLSKKISGEISRGISSGAMYAEIARNIASWGRIPMNNAMRIARTEAHRIQIQATADAQWKAKENGADVVKQWDAALDKRTRDSHARVDGEIRELDEKFSNGLEYPGDPKGRPEEVINCRCALLQRARWALGNDYTKWSEDAPIEIADDGTSQLAKIEAKNYKDFKEKYSQASERVRENVQKMNDEGTWIPKKTASMKRDPAMFRKTSERVETSDMFEELPQFKNADSINKAIEEGKRLTTSGDFKVDGIHLNTVNGFNEAMFNVKQRFGKKLNITGIKAVKSADAKYHQASFDPLTKMVSLKGGKSANALTTYKNNAEKFFKSGWNASSDVYGTFYHEIGHSIWAELPTAAKNEIVSLYKETKHNAYTKWMELGGLRSGFSQADVFGKELSRYAIENAEEFFGEAFSQIMSGRMRPVSRQVNMILHKYYKA